jgi:hypothetical protein
MTAEKDIHHILSAFVENITTEKELEKYWTRNSTAVNTIKRMDSSLYLDLVEKFKAQRKTIQSKSVEVT